MLWGLAAEARCEREAGERLDCVLQRLRGVLQEVILGLGIGDWGLEGRIGVDGRMGSNG